MKIIDERINHAITIKEEYYVFRFDGKEFNVKIRDYQRHHKDYPEDTIIEIKQEPSFQDRKKIHELLLNELKKEVCDDKLFIDEKEYKK